MSMAGNGSGPSQAQSQSQSASSTASAPSTTGPIEQAAAAPVNPNFTRRRYEVKHRTAYTYDEDVTTCYERGFLKPRATAYQRVLSHDLQVTPDPDVLTEHTDHFGNESAFIEVRTPHKELVVTKTSIVEIDRAPVDVAALNRFTVAQAAQQLDRVADPVERMSYLLPSDLVEIGPEVRDYAQTYLAPDRPLGDAVDGLCRGIFKDFQYKKAVTSTKTTLPELLELRAGVCQDFAHLAAGCLRSVGLPARYVSGYIETSPPPGKPKLAGSDATHAWTSVMVPDGADGASWIDLDPTNDHFADSRYIVTAWGRDFRDVSPLKGVIYTDAKNSSLDVGVDVTRLPEPTDSP